MKALRIFFLCLMIKSLICQPVMGQQSYCENLNFEMGNFTNWQGHTWIYSYDEPQENTDRFEEIAARRHEIMFDTSEYDAFTGYELKKIPPGYNYSCRLGDAIYRHSLDPCCFRCWNQSLRYTMTIDSSNALLVLKFALVLEYADDHSFVNEPRFRLTLYDEHGDTIPDCANYDWNASNSAVDGFNLYYREDDDDPIQWRDWTTVGANLMKFYGETITVEFMTADCGQHYHFGYAYFVAECHPLYITVDFCSDDTEANLIAPEGFERYQWTNSSNNSVGNSQTLVVSNPVEGEEYYCEMLSATGCEVSLQATVVRYVPKADFSSYMLDCHSNTVQFTNLSTKTNGTLKFLWDFGEGRATTIKDPQYTFATSGMHPMILDVFNPPSSCVDSKITDVESFSPPLVGIAGDSTYCQDSSVFIRGYGAVDYTWSTGSKNDSIEIADPGGTFWLLGRSSTGCVSDTNYKTINQEPNWEFISDGDTILCENSNVTLSVDGAQRYFWNTTDTNRTIVVDAAGNYSVVGINPRGCKKHKVFHIEVNPLPRVDFETSKLTLDRRNSEISCNIAEQEGVEYLWDMGDGLNEYGALINHVYQVSNSTLLYTILLQATDEFGCTDTSTTVIDVHPFVPNVFSPNNDGINDVFMARIDLQVFDRNGIPIYNGMEGWNGKYREKDAIPDTYFYIIKFTDRNLKMHTKKGFVTLVR